MVWLKYVIMTYSVLDPPVDLEFPDGEAEIPFDVEYNHEIEVGQAYQKEVSITSWGKVMDNVDYNHIYDCSIKRPSMFSHRSGKSQPAAPLGVDQSSSSSMSPQDDGCHIREDYIRILPMNSQDQHEEPVVKKARIGSKQKPPVAFMLESLQKVKKLGCLLYTSDAADE